MYAMKWSDRDQSYNHPDNHGKWVAIDHSSGGYPWAVEYFGNQTEIWQTLEDARDYQRSFPCLDIYALFIGTEKVKDV